MIDRLIAVHFRSTLTYSSDFVLLSAAADSLFRSTPLPLDRSAPTNGIDFGRFDRFS
ncbi:MAG: hypothetical protein HUU54_15215 [Ignavibacteriaceae bacterium]|nr:hypothetical protein [Ignavibacteriaceae bacterium]